MESRLYGTVNSHLLLRGRVIRRGLSDRLEDRGSLEAFAEELADLLELFFGETEGCGG